MAVDAIMDKKSDPIFWQCCKLDTSKKVNITCMDINSLKDAYFKYGLDVFKNYSFLTPSYITENGDIFNVDDTTFVTKNPNYKIVIMQSFNMYEILEKYKGEIQNIKYGSTSYSEYLDSFITIRFVKTISIDVIIILVTIIFVNIYNSERIKKGIERDGDNVKK
jgi:hypothetical protein